MIISKETMIKYTFKSEKLDDEFSIKLSLEQVEGSVPNFYEQIQDVCKIKHEDYEIVKREIIEE